MSFEAYLGVDGGTATIHLIGELDSGTAPRFQSLIERAAQGKPDRFVVDMTGLTQLSASGVRCLAYLQQVMEPHARVILLGAAPPILERIEQAAFDSAVTLVR